MNRTDVHSPTNLVTEDYEYAYCYDAHPEDGDRGAAQFFLNRLLDEGFRFGQVHGGDTCDHCGARLRYVAVLKHLPTTTLIKVGETCLDNRFSMASAAFHKLRKNAALNRDRMKLADKCQKWLDADPDNAAAHAFLVDAVEVQGNYGFNGFYFDLLHKLNRYGDLSERQVAAVLRAKARDEERAAKRAEEALTASPVVEGKILVTGEILTVKWQESHYGGALKMLVRDDRGFKVWGTCPTSLDNVHTDEDGRTSGVVKGDRVAFTATVEASNDDPTFGFFKRPSKAGLVVA